MFGLLKKSEALMAERAVVMAPVAVEAAVIEAAPVIEEIPFPDKPTAFKADPMLSEDAYTQYADVASQVGFMVPEMLIERLKLFLIKRDLPVYELKAVVKYMDAIAKRDNPNGYGWHWLPLRDSDTKFGLHFGTAGSNGNGVFDMWMSRGREKEEKILATDYFASAHYWNGGSSPVAGYNKVVPMHALQRVALIEKEFGPGKVAFAVSDYATEPHIRPDPFLMAMVPNSRVSEGVGRFVIDVWDEPGFGILEMVK